jgi:bacterioferritin-associated ferredoxin
MIVCLCRRVSDRTIRAAVAGGARTVEEVGQACRAGTGCGACHEYIAEVIHERSVAERTCGGDCADCPGAVPALLSPYVQVA